MSVKMGWFNVVFISLCVFKEFYVQCAVTEGGNCLLPDHNQCAILPDVCQDPSLSHQLCPHLCGFCASAVTTGTPQPTTTLPSTTATPTPTLGTLLFKWTFDHSDGPVKYMCRGQDLYLPVTYTLAHGQQVASIQWYFRGQSEEIVAMVTSHGQFVPMPSFANRVEFVPPAGIVVKNVVPSDSGNYTVEVVSHGGSNSFPDQRLTFVVDVTGNVSPSSDHDVLTMERTAVYNATTDQWAIGLTCGKMSSLGQPPVDVVWTTPTGERKASTSFRNGSFLLTLDNPVKGGNYSCSIDPSSPAKACLSGSSGLLQRADVIVDEELAILVLKEARQEAEITRLQHQNQELTSQATNLTSQVHSLTSQATNLTSQTTSLTSQVHSLTSQVHSLEATDANLTSYIERLEHNLTHCIQNTVTTATPTTPTPTTATTTPKPDPCAGGNHAVLDDAWRDVHQVNTHHCDSNLTTGWYRFRLNGHNAVIPTTCVLENHCGTYVTIWLDMGGKPMPDLGQQTTGWAYGSVASATSTILSCRRTQHSPVTVLNCGAFFVYYLYHAIGCSSAYCAMVSH